MAHALGCERLDLYLQHDRPLGDAELERIRGLLRRRGAREPVAYLLGRREFHGLTLAVDTRVLVPRPETEHLVECAVAFLRSRATPVVADVGTGSGCVALAVLHAVPDAIAHATDCSTGALEVARANAAALGVEARLSLHAGDLLEPLRALPVWGRLDAVLSNPPYVVRGDPTVEPGVREHEPEAALYVPGDDPLEVARRIAVAAREALAPGGLLALEVGFGSGAAAFRMLVDLGYVEVATIRDLAGIERIVHGRR